MSISANISVNFTKGTETIHSNVTVTDDGDDDRDLTIPASTTNELIAFVCTRTQMKLLYMVSTVDMTIKTNSTGSPGDTISLAANVPYFYATGLSTLNPLNADITSLYASNAGAVDGTLRVRCIRHTSP